MKSAILIAARLKSSRLPKKVIKPIKMKPMICHMLDRLKLAQKPKQIIICTSTIEQDDPLIEIAKRENVEHFRGDPDDVLLRLTDAAGYFNIDIAVSCTADNPFTDPVFIDHLIDFHIKNEHDFSSAWKSGLPLGTFSYVVSYPAMVKACKIKAEYNTEFWTLYFMETGLFKWSTMKVTNPDVCWPELRLTVDTPEDFEMINRIFDELYEPSKIFPLNKIIRLCRQKPEIPAINASVKQKTPILIKSKPGVKTND